MTTILNSAKYNGNCLISGKKSEIEIFPGKKESGIVFTKSDSSAQFVANLNNILDTTHAVTLGTPEFHVKVAEHFIAALALARISDIEIFINGDEMPICDGSARIYYALLKKAGIASSSENLKYNLNKELSYSFEHTSITAIPAESFRITYVSNYVNSPFEYSWYKWEVEKDSIDDIISARTFGYVKDLPLYQSMGLALGVTPDNTVGLNDDGTLTTELRYPNEPIRHKILDLIGDLYLSGINPMDLNAHVIVIECGHTQHLKMAGLIKDNVSIA